jgi:hypothetical protein
VIVFRQRPEITVVPRYPENGFQCSGLTFTDIARDDSAGFYDWLRHADGRLIGVRYCTAPDYSDWPFVGDLLQLPYTSKTSGTTSCLEIFFGTDRTYLGPKSNDQDWGDNGLFQAQDGTYAITVALSRLSTMERGSLDEFIGDAKAEML